MIVREIDLTAAEPKKGGRRSRHSEIKADGTPYLALIGGRWSIGTFSEVWHGLNFRDDYWPVGIQFDAPGTNASPWERLFELMPYEEAVATFDAVMASR